MAKGSFVVEVTFKGLTRSNESVQISEKYECKKALKWNLRTRKVWLSSDVYFGPYQASVTELFSEKSFRFLAVNCFRKIAPSWMFDRVRNTTLVNLSSIRFCQVPVRCFTDIDEMKFKCINIICSYHDQVAVSIGNTSLLK